MHVLPGDEVPVSRRYGPGIFGGEAAVAGELKERNGIPYIASRQGRYAPALHDNVVGVVQMKGSEVHRVELQPFSRPALLNAFAFENATKKNRPNLKRGDVVYGRITNCHPDLDVEIECFDSKTGKSAGFGQLKEGTVVFVGCGFARKLLYEGDPLLEELGKRYSFELAVGVNGRVWVKGRDLSTTLAVSGQLEAQGRKFEES